MLLALARGPRAACAATCGSVHRHGLSVLLQPALPSRKLPLVISWLIFELDMEHP